MTTPTQITLTPRVSEKSFKLSEGSIYVFIVPNSINKHEIKEAVETQFSVTVTKVRTAVVKGKVKASVQKRKAPRDGVRKNTKRAYVSVKKGDSIPIFEEAR